MQFSVRCFLSVVAASILLSFVAVHASFLSQSSKSRSSSSVSSVSVSSVSSVSSVASTHTRTRTRTGVGSSYSSTGSMTTSVTTSVTSMAGQLQDRDNIADSMNDDDDLWSPLDPESLVSAPCLIEQTLCQAAADNDSGGGGDGPRVAKDYDYAVAVLDAWKEQEAAAADDDGAGAGAGAIPWRTESRPIAYSCTDDSSATTTTTLYGRLVRRQRKRRRQPLEESSNPTPTPSNSPNRSIPGIIFFHTGAGPHDVFLLWKAAALVNSMNNDTDNDTDDDTDDTDTDGPTILVADILSDATGWAWDDDKTQYTAARDTVLAVKKDANHDNYGNSNNNSNNGNNGNNDNDDSHQYQYRPVLQQRIRAAIDTLLKVEPRVDPENLAALGWCLGGHSILELGRMQVQQQQQQEQQEPQTQTQIPWRMRAMVTFHGVFDGLPPPAAAAAAAAADELDEDNDDRDDTDTDVNGDIIPNKYTSISPPPPPPPKKKKKTEILICHGLQDPFVSDQSLERALATLTVTGHIVSLLQLQGAKHGFTNPAQDFNDNPALAFDANSANKAWRQAMALLRRACAPS